MVAKQETFIDRSTDQTVTPKGGKYRLDPNDVKPVERTEVRHMGRRPGEKEGTLLEVDADLDIMTVVAKIQSRIRCIVEVQGAKIFITPSSPAEAARLEMMLNEIVGNDDAVTRVDNFRDYQEAA